MGRVKPIDPRAPAPAVCVFATLNLGLERRWERMRHALCSAGWSITVICPGSAPAGAGVARPVVLKPPKNRFQRFVLLPLVLLRYVLPVRADAYLYFGGELVLAGCLLALLGRKVVFDMQENWHEQLAHKTWIPRGLRAAAAYAYRKIEAFSLPRHAAVTVAGAAMARRLASRCRRVEHLQNFPILDEIREMVALERGPRGDFVVLNGAGVAAERATACYLESVDRLDDLPGARFVLAGAAASKDYLEHLDRSGRLKNIEYLGRVSWARMRALYGEASVAVVLYSNQPNHLEIRSNRLYEALAAALPVIVPDFGEWKHFVEQHQVGIAVDPGSPEHLASAIRWMYVHREAAAEMGARGRRLVLESANWEAVAPRVTRVFAALRSA